ncbi:hypothetical protein B0H11DRAFT_2371455 [Mycena galericulata]|nr:hypothetical protein B0H11DRAFT_2371455 [Mycena galericulata]
MHCLVDSGLSSLTRSRNLDELRHRTLPHRVKQAQNGQGSLLIQTAPSRRKNLSREKKKRHFNGRVKQRIFGAKSGLTYALVLVSGGLGRRERVHRSNRTFPRWTKRALKGEKPYIVDSELILEEWANGCKAKRGQSHIPVGAIAMDPTFARLSHSLLKLFKASIPISDGVGLYFDIVLAEACRSNGWQRNSAASSEISLAVDEDIPCLEDMFPITQAAELAFHNEGARSVCLQMGGKIVRYHLSKIRLIMNVNNQSYNLHAISRVLDRVVSSSLLPELIEELNSTFFASHSLGFMLLRRRFMTSWVLEDVLNARAEMIYFRRGAVFFEEEPSFLFLPTSFINDCRTLMALPHAPYSAELVRLRGRIRSGKVDMLGFVNWRNDHFSGIFKFALSDLLLGDSLHLPAAPDILPILRWAFYGLHDFAPPPTQTHIESGLIDRQRTLVGGGSCGIAAMNFVENRVGLDIPRWRAAQSARFRDSVLRELLLFHLIAPRKTTVYSDWVVSCTLVGAGEIPGFVPDVPVGYNDFNLHMLSANENLSAKITSSSAGSSSGSTLGAPFALQGPHNAVPPISQLSELTLEPNFDFSFNTSASSTASRHRAPALRKSPPPPPSAAAVAKRLNNSGSVIIVPDTPSPPKTPPPRKVKQEILDLCSPDVVDLVTPPRLATKEDIQELMSPFRPSVKRKHIPNAPTVAKAEPVSTIDLVSPPRRKLKTDPAGAPERQITMAPGPLRVGKTYSTLQEGIDHIFAVQEALGHKYILAQSRKDDNGVLRKRTIRCNRYRNPTETQGIKPSRIFTDRRPVKTDTSPYRRQA